MVTILLHTNKAIFYNIYSTFFVTSVLVKSITADSRCFLSSSVFNLDHMLSKYALWYFCMNLKQCFKVAPICRVFNLASNLPIFVMNGKLLVTNLCGPCLTLTMAICVCSLQYFVIKPLLIAATP